MNSVYNIDKDGNWVCSQNGVPMRVFKEGVWHEYVPPSQGKKSEESMSLPTTSSYLGGEQYYQPTAHVRFKTTGSHEKREFFDFLMARIDSDYPFPPESLVLISEGRRKTQPTCSTCGGKKWPRPIWGPEEVKRLAKQVNQCKELPGHFGLRVKRWEREDKCPVKWASTHSPSPSIIEAVRASFAGGGAD